LIGYPGLLIHHIPISSSKKLILGVIRFLRENYNKRELCIRGYKGIYFLHFEMYNYCSTSSEVPMVIKTEW
jgi:hypothetical protein